MSSRTTSSTNMVSFPKSDRQADLLTNSLETAIASATEGAIATAFQWGTPVNRENRAAGGLHWATYKAICRRNGIYTNSQGPHVSDLTSNFWLQGMENHHTDLTA